jgi:hypothetical protein
VLNELKAADVAPLRTYILTIGNVIYGMHVKT